MPLAGHSAGRRRGAKLPEDRPRNINHRLLLIIVQTSQRLEQAESRFAQR
jgi:hypothetical protein